MPDEITARGQRVGLAEVLPLDQETGRLETAQRAAVAAQCVSHGGCLDPVGFSHERGGTATGCEAL